MLYHDHCKRHYEEPFADRCNVCDGPFCERCLVYAFGPKKPPYCIGCALKVSGVRSSAGAPAVPKSMKQKRQKPEPVVSGEKPRRSLFRRRRSEPPLEPQEWDDAEGRVPSMAELGIGNRTEPGTA